MLKALLKLSLACGALSLDYEWPNPSAATRAAVVIRHDTGEQLGDGGFALGAALVPSWDGGALVGPAGFRAVRGPTNIWGRIDTVNEGWPDPATGGSYEVCFTPAWDPAADWIDGQTPAWNGTIYLFDAYNAYGHTLAIIFGAMAKGQLQIRTSSSLGYTDLFTTVSTPRGQAHCVAVEWAPVGAGKCTLTARLDSCGTTPPALCSAATVVAQDLSGNAYCPGPPSYAFLGNRWSETAPTSVDISALRVRY